MEIFLRFTFEAAHRLPHVAPDHKCARIHGHGYEVEIRVGGPVDPVLGWVVDFADIDRAWAPIADQLDHHYLNDIPGLENPTCEHLVRWIWRRLKPALPGLLQLSASETRNSGCIYRGEDEPTA